MLYFKYVVSIQDKQDKNINTFKQQISRNHRHTGDKKLPYAILHYHWINTIMSPCCITHLAAFNGSQSEHSISPRILTISQKHCDYWAPHVMHSSTRGWLFIEWGCWIDLLAEWLIRAVGEIYSIWIPPINIFFFYICLLWKSSGVLAADLRYTGRSC